MITTKTTLVVGAGASVDYGMLSGPGLLAKAQRVPAEVADQICSAVGCSRSDIQRFTDALTKSRLPSVDSFLETRREFEPIGKAVIASILGPALTTLNLDITPDGDWIQYLFNRMHAGTETFTDFDNRNDVSIITFNFDHIIEDKLATALFHSYLNVSDESARVRAAGLVTHLHGEISPCSSHDMTAHWLKTATSGISVVYQDIGPRMQTVAMRLLREATVVCFLGFGYHDTNLAKLGVPESTKDAVVMGTAYGLGDGERERVRGRFKSIRQVSLGQSLQGCITFLKEHHVLRD